MPTVESIARQKMMTADLSGKIFRTNNEAANRSVLIKGPTDTADDMIKSGFGLRSNISEMLGNYTEEKNNFNSEFDRTMSSIKESAEKFREDAQVKQDEQLASRREALETEYNRRESAERFADAAREKFAENEEIRRERAAELNAENIERVQENLRSQRENAENFANAVRERIQSNTLTRRDETERFAQQYLVSETQNMNATRNENSNAALSNVRDLVRNFNDAVTFFNENRGVSNRMSALAISFTETENFADSLNAVGITNENGQLRVNETRLTDALNRNSEDVNELLGRNGLAGRLDRTVELANSQRENLFPSVVDYVGSRREEPTESLYALQLNQTAAHARENNWHFLNMFT